MTLRLPPALPDEVITEMVDASMELVRRYNLPVSNRDWWAPSNEGRDMMELIDDNIDCFCETNPEYGCSVYGYGFELMDEEPGYVISPRNGYTPIHWANDFNGEYYEEFDTAEEAVLV